MRTLIEAPRGCGYRKDGGCYLVGETGPDGNLPSVVEIDPPIPLDTDVIPFTRGVYTVNFDAVLTESDQRLWLVDTSKESLRQRDAAAWELDRYGMRLQTRLRTGICAGMEPNQAENRLAELARAKNSTLRIYALNIAKAGRGRRIARETGVMQQAVKDRDWIALLASCWRLALYDGSGSATVRRNIKRLMVSIGATEDAILI